MKKIIFIAVLIFTLSSCITPKQQEERKETSPIDCLIESVSKWIKENANADPPSLLRHRYATGPFFCQGENGKILIFGVEELTEIYNNDFAKTDLKIFLKQALSQEIILHPVAENNLYNYGLGKSSFYVDSSIVKEYQEKGFKDFLLSYYEDRGDGEYSLYNGWGIELDKRSTIFYLLFLNNYSTSFSEYGGYWYAGNMSMICE
jgi:hypothetical protein